MGASCLVNAHDHILGTHTLIAHMRQDPESSNSNLKRIMGRARGHGSRRLRLHMLSYQLLLLVTSLVAHHQETGDDISDFFGGGTPAARDGP